MEWRTIDSAPKDGTWVDLYRDPPKIGTWQTRVSARWHTFNCGDSNWVWPDRDYEVMTEAGRENALDMIADGDFYEANNFTHWMPLPTPPQSGK